MKARISGNILKVYERKNKETGRVSYGCHFYTEEGDFCNISGVPSDFQNFAKFDQVNDVPVKIDVWEGRQTIQFDAYAE